MILNEIKAVFGYGRETYTAVQWQYSYGQILVIENLDLPDTFEAHFSKDYGGGTSKTQIGTNNRVTIPYEYFEQIGNIYCFIFLHEGEDDGETRYCITIPLKSRPKPTEEAPTEHEQTAIEQAIMALNTAVIEADGYAEDAQHSANDASESAESASQSAHDAQTSAESAQDSANRASASEASASASAISAQQSATSASTSAQSAKVDADRAEQASANAGYMFFYIDSNGDLIYQRTSNTQVDFYLREGDLYVEARV